jgi:D-serine deaminase-like pyridoxal phosphate-dependent protein
VTSTAEPAAALTFPALPSGLDTPSVVVDLVRMDANIRRLQDAMDQRGIAVRPHAKTHKSVAVARRQLAAGARGITVGTIGEAEVFAAAGIDDLFLAYPIWASGSKGDRVRALHERLPAFRVGVDSAAGARRLAEAVEGVGRPLSVLVEVDPGLHRTGVRSPGVAVDVARAAREARLEVIGVFSHGAPRLCARGPGASGCRRGPDPDRRGRGAPRGRVRVRDDQRRRHPDDPQRGRGRG